MRLQGSIPTSDTCAVLVPGAAPVSSSHDSVAASHCSPGLTTCRTRVRTPVEPHRALHRDQVLHSERAHSADNGQHVAWVEWASTGCSGTPFALFCSPGCCSSQGPSLQAASRCSSRVPHRTAPSPWPSTTMCRLLRLMPLPQLAEQSLQAAQSESWQSTGGVPPSAPLPLVSLPLPLPSVPDASLPSPELLPAGGSTTGQDASSGGGSGHGRPSLCWISVDSGLHSDDPDGPGQSNRRVRVCTAKWKGPGRGQPML